jgi:hypothetical protein
MSWARVTRSGTTHIPTHRWSISLDGNGAPADYQITVPADHPFWEVIDSNGYELQICDSDGYTVISYQLSGFNYSTKTLAIQIDAYTAVAGVQQIWLYAGMSGAPSGASVLTITSARSGYLDPAEPASPIIAAIPERAGDTIPAVQIAKQAAEETWVTLDMRPSLTRKLQPTGDSTMKHDEWEEIKTITYAVYAGASAQAAMVDATSPRIQAGRWIRFLVKAGSSGTNYTFRATIGTTYPDNVSGRTLVRSFKLQVYTVAE